MQTLQKFSKDTAKKFSATDWIGLVETLFNLFKECRAARTPPAQVRANIRQGGGLIARLRTRRAIKQNIDRTNMSLREVNALADYIMDEALNPANDAKLEAIVKEMYTAEDMNLNGGPVHNELATDVPAEI